MMARRTVGVLEERQDDIDFAAGCRMLKIVKGGVCAEMIVVCIGCSFRGGAGVGCKRLRWRHRCRGKRVVATYRFVGIDLWMLDTAA